MLNLLCGKQFVNLSCYMDRIVSISVAQILKLWKPYYDHTLLITKLHIYFNIVSSEVDSNVTVQEGRLKVT